MERTNTAATRAADAFAGSGTATDAVSGPLRALERLDPEDEKARAARKRRQIQHGAVGEFLRHGYVGTGVDHVAAAARVSKQTVYKHFGSKEELFLSILEGTVGEVLDELFHRVDPRLGESADLEDDLRALARRYIVLLLRPEFLALRRLVIGEATRFPQLGHAWHAGGPGRFTAELASHLQRLADGGALTFTDAELAAQQFTWLVVSIPLNHALLCPDQHFAQDELHRYADDGVRIFLAAYRPPQCT